LVSCTKKNLATLVTTSVYFRPPQKMKIVFDWTKWTKIKQKLFHFFPGNRHSGYSRKVFQNNTFIVDLWRKSRTNCPEASFLKLSWAPTLRLGANRAKSNTSVGANFSRRPKNPFKKLPSGAVV
jgi:hypothetical protein